MLLSFVNKFNEKNTEKCKKSSHQTSRFGSYILVQVWCNKCENPIVLMPRQGVDTDICPLIWGIIEEKQAVV